MKFPAPSQPSRRKEGLVDITEIAGFDGYIDARSPAEFAEDHLPGAINLPVLDNDERARVGTLHNQIGAFEAKRVGAALVSRNIARHLEGHFADKPRHYRQLVYCWRGGSRSGAFTTVLRAVGWGAVQLEGGYKAYRRHVIKELERIPEQFRFRVVCGPTGVGKSRFLRALERNGAQVLDLEAMAVHMGSVLGAYPDQPQPSQKLFESRVWHALRGFDPARPVFVESESKRIGILQTPDNLLEHMRWAHCLTLTAPMAVRVALLLEEYAHFLTNPETLAQRLDCLVQLQGRERIENWKAMTRSGQWQELVTELLVRHYDPAYKRSLGRNYPQAAEGTAYTITSHRPDFFLEFARQVAASVA